MSQQPIEPGLADSAAPGQSFVYRCVICAAPLVEVDTVAACSFCSQETPASYLCPHGHHICEDCQLAGPLEAIERVCAGAPESDPGRIVNRIMQHPAIVMHGPAHHAMVAPAVLAALANSGQRTLKAGRLKAVIGPLIEVPVMIGLVNVAFALGRRMYGLQQLGR